MMVKRFLAFAAVLAVLASLPWVWALGSGAGGRENPAASDEIVLASATGLTAGRSTGDWQQRLEQQPAVPPVAARPGIEPRRPLTRLPDHELRQLPQDFTGKLIVKFHDGVRARAEGNENRMVSRAGVDIDFVTAMLDDLGLAVEPMFSRSEAQLQALQERAVEFSGRGQPDLAGMVHITGPEASIVDAAQFLNRLEIVEFVEYEVELYHTGGEIPGACCLPGGGCRENVPGSACADFGGDFAGPESTCADCAWGGAADMHLGACCLPGGGCQDDANPVACEADPDDDGAGGVFMGAGTECATVNCLDFPGACCVPAGPNTFCIDVANEPECVVEGGFYLGALTECDPDDNPCAGFEPECGVPGVGDCFEVGTTPFCNDGGCCALVCDQDPFCCDEDQPWPGRGDPHWDIQCVSIAEAICPGAPAPPDVDPACFSPLAGTCFSTNSTPGCQLQSCCAVVCDANQACCDAAWTVPCVLLANELCTVDPGDGVTPDFSNLQGYLTPGGYVQELGALPAALLPAIPVFPGTLTPRPGYGGQGYDFDALWDFSHAVLEHEFPECIEDPSLCEENNLVTGKSIRVGIVEHTAHVFHEDLVDRPGGFFPEPDQTVIVIPTAFLLNGHHGTATLGIVGADHSSGTGMSGLAPDVELHFFPIVSLEEGGRFANAMASAMDTFDHGDVLSFSIGPRNGTLATPLGNWTLLRMAADLGITCVISAGNECLNLDGIAQADDADADVIIVGAVTPGLPYCRLGFSNFCQACQAPHQVHISAWGQSVATLGYGALFVGLDDEGLPDQNRLYTMAFNGTSAAAPMVAGLTARLQAFSKQFYGIPLMPAQIRAMVGGDTVVEGSHFLQCGFPPLQAPPGSPFPRPCLGDYDLDEPPNRVGTIFEDGSNVFTLTPLAAEMIVVSEFFDVNSLIEDIEVIRGEYLWGNVFSIYEVDGSFFQGASMFTQPASGPSFVPAGTEGPLGNITYLATGQIVDYLILARAEEPVAAGLGMVSIAAPTAVPTVTFIELYDWDASAWSVVGANFAPAGAAATAVGNGFNATRFIHNDTLQILGRIWVYGFTMPSTSPNAPTQVPFEHRLDFVDLEISIDGFIPIPQPDE